MISFTVNIADAQQLGVAAEALRKMLEALQPPATPPSREDMEAAIKTAEQIHAKAAKAPKPEPVQKTESPAATPPAAAPAVTTEPTAPVVTATESPSDLDYATLARRITETAKTDRERVVAVLGKFGAKKGTDLKPEQWQAVWEALA